MEEISNIVDSLLMNPTCEPFYEPVNWRELELFDYPEIITNRIDLGTIKRRLQEGNIYSTSQQVAGDIRLIWKNCMTYNTEGSDFWLLAKMLAIRFEDRYREIQKKDSASLLSAEKVGRRSSDESDFRTKSASNSHMRICNASACNTSVRLSMRPTSLRIQRAHLSDFNILVTESIELIELAECDVERFAIRPRKRDPQCGDVGIRCFYCATDGVQPPGSVSYPTNLKNISCNVYNMMKRHLLVSCKHIPKRIRRELITAKEYTTSQSMQKEKIGLTVYLEMLVQEFSLANKDGEKHGIQRIIGSTSVGSSSDEDDVSMTESVPNESVCCSPEELEIII